MTYRISLLADRSSALPQLANLFIDEWAPWYGPNGKGNAKSDLEQSMNHSRLPIAVVAENEFGQVLGTAALKQESLGSEHGFGPWLAALVVVPDFRGKGIGLSLVQAVEEHAQRLSYKQIYSSTNTSNSLFEKCGWFQMRQSSASIRGPVAIYSKVFK